MQILFLKGRSQFLENYFGTANASRVTSSKVDPDDSVHSLVFNLSDEENKCFFFWFQTSTKTDADDSVDSFQASPQRGELVFDSSSSE